MSELQKVEQEIHQKMVQRVQDTITQGTTAASVSEPFPMETLKDISRSTAIINHEMPPYGNSPNYSIPSFNQEQWNSMDLKHEDLLNLANNINLGPQGLQNKPSINNQFNLISDDTDLYTQVGMDAQFRPSCQGGAASTSGKVPPLNPQEPFESEDLKVRYMLSFVV